MENSEKFQVKKITRMVQTIDDYTTEAKSKNLIWAFAEFDVTEARRHLKEHFDKTGEKVSFTAFLIACFSRVVEKHKYPMNTLRFKKKQFYIFDEVDVLTNIEREMDGIKKPTSYTVRNAQIKSLREIHDEIRAAQTVKKVELTQGAKKGKGLIKIFPKLPRFVRKIAIHYIFTHPLVKKQMLGTVGVTSVGMFGDDLGYMIHITPHTISFGVGAIGNRLRKENGEIVEKEVLGSTIAMDHAIIDGGPATRFFQDLFTMMRDDCHDKDWCFKSL